MHLGEAFKVLVLGGEDTAARVSLASSAFGEAVAADPSHAPSQFSHAYLLTRQHRFTEAKRAFSGAIRAEGNGGSCKTLFHLASLIQLYLYEEATDPVEKARNLEVHPSPQPPAAARCATRAGRGCGPA